mmetsp:Transcript_4938/g.6389  ORF Transcript_4938/g.6389 Transcript_4938/m.6389 type:complete len:1070 (-) Transcript_4938:124-3333(-)
MSDRVSVPIDGLRDRVVIRKAAEKFNVSVKDGINHLVQNKIIQSDSPAEVARVFHEIQGLSKRKIGEFLGKPTAYNQQVLSAWLGRLNLSDLDIDQGIRHMILKMRLPGEAQQIDRMIEKFASEYAAQNPDFEGGVDLVYVLSFSIIMLNTDLHNPSIPRKMSCAAFIHNNRGIDNGKDIPAEVLTRIYQRIKADPIRMDEDDMFESEVSTFVAPLRSGWLWKKGGGHLSTSKKYWFVVTDGCLYYFVSRQDRSPRAIIPLEQCRVAASRSKPDLIILARHDGQYLKTMKMAQNGMRLSQHRQFIFQSALQERDAWVVSFQEAIRSLLSDEMGLTEDVTTDNGTTEPIVYQDPSTGDSLKCSEADSPSDLNGDTSRDYTPTLIMTKDDGSKARDDSISSLKSRISRSKSTSRNFDSDSEVGDNDGISSHSLFMSRPSSVSGSLGEAHLLQGRVSASRARGFGDTNLILLTRVSQNVSMQTTQSSGLLEELGRFLRVIAHIKESLASSSAVPPISRGLNNHSGAVGAYISKAASAERPSVKGSAQFVAWTKSAEKLLKKYDKQRSYNAEVLMKLQALERSVYVVCRICVEQSPDEDMEVVCEGYGDRELGLLEGEGEWKSFRFDKVWGIDVPQQQVFKDADVLLSSVIDGHCACVIGVGDKYRPALMFGKTAQSGDVHLGLAYHAASELWDKIRQDQTDGDQDEVDGRTLSVFMGEVQQSGEVVDLLSDIESGVVTQETDIGINMTKVVMTSTSHLKSIFEYAFHRRSTGNAILCFDLSHSSGRLLVVDQALEEETPNQLNQGTEVQSMGDLMRALSSAVMQLGTFGGSAEYLRAILGEQSVALAIYCVGNQESDLVATSKYLMHSASMQNQLQTSSGQSIVEGQVVQIHIRALKTRIASARQSVESLHADAENLLYERKKLQTTNTVSNEATVNIYEEEVASARTAMDTQVGLLVSGLDQMTDYLKEEASSRDRHIARLTVIEEEVMKLEQEGKARRSTEEINLDLTKLKSALQEAQESIEVLLREMHVSIISKILAHKNEAKQSFRERKRQSSIRNKQAEDAGNGSKF